MTAAGDRPGAYRAAARDRDVPKHRGLSSFIIDVGQPGIEVRPLHQMNGEHGWSRGPTGTSRSRTSPLAPSASVSVSVSVSRRLDHGT